MIFVGDDWAEAHHDVCLMDEAGTKLVARRLPEGLAGVARLHEMVAEHTSDPAEVVVGIETDWSSPHVLDTWFMRPCDGSSCPPIRLVAGSRWWSGAGGGCTRLRSSTGLIGGRGGGSGSCFG